MNKRELKLIIREMINEDKSDFKAITGKVKYTEDELYEKFPWLKKGKFKNAEIKVWKDKLIWNNGTWLSGTFKGFQWFDGTFKDGRFEGNNWYGGTFAGGNWFGNTWDGGTFKNGIWEDGVWNINKGSKWEGGRWISGYISDLEQKSNKETKLNPAKYELKLHRAKKGTKGKNKWKKVN